jgi:predicted amidohydrolase
MKISLVQFSSKWEDKTANMGKITRLIGKNAMLGDLIVFPEMTLTGFTMKSKIFAETVKGESIKFFSTIAREHKIHLFFGLIEKVVNKFYNSLFHLDEFGSIISKYRKVHPFSYSTEDKFYSAGEKIVVTNVKDWKIGLSICYDLRFPELFRLYARKKVDLIINIANWPDTRIEHWRTLLKARAIENQCYVAGVNRVGNDPKLHYSGYSSVFDPMGKEIVVSKDKEEIISENIDKNYLKEVRKKLPFLPDMKLI